MEIDTLQLGGKHHGAVAIRPVGTTTQEDALAYAHIGRKVLGEFKQRLQQADTLSGHYDVTLSDGTAIRVVSNMQGLSPIDQIYVDTGNRRQVKKGGTCYGYVVQVFLEPESVTASAIQSYMKVTLPSGKVLGAKYGEDHGKLTNANANALAWDNYPDNGAKYATNKVTALYPTPEMQTVIVKDFVWYQTLTLVPKTIALNGAVSYPLPSINPAWSYVANGYFASGTCSGTPWEESLGPCWAEWDFTANDLTGSTVYGTVHMESYGMAKVDPCGASGVYPYTGTGYAELDFYNAAALYYRYTYYDVPALPYISSIYDAYNASYAASNGVSVDLHTYGMFNAAVRATEVVRRDDDKGFVSDSGFYFGDNKAVVFTKRNGTDGSGVVYMMPTGTERNFRYSDEISTQVNTLSDSTWQTTLSYNYEAPSRTPDPPGSFPCLTYTGDVITGIDSMPIIGEVYTYTGGYYDVLDREGDELVESFGLPVKVEAGIHKVEIQDGTAESNANRKARIYLLTDSYGLVRVERRNITTTLTGSVRSWNPIRIKVGEFKTLEEIVT